MKLKSTAKNKPNISKSYKAVLFIALIIIVYLKFFQIDERPLHNDEAVNAIKFQTLLENGEFTYNPVEYHGLTLYYFTLLPAFLFGQSYITEVNELTLRSVTIFFGILFLLFIYFLRNEIDIIALITIVLLALFSPTINYYNRYYIHESIFAASSFILLTSFYKYSIKFSYKWLILSGLSAGIVYSTKETSVIVFAGFLLSIILTKTFSFNLKSISIFLSIFVFTSLLFYTSFFSNIEGINNSFKTFFLYLSKATSNAEHIHPWYYYLKFLFFNNYNHQPSFEILIMLLGIVGIIYSVKSNSSNTFAKIISIFTISILFIYSLIPYKTPWNMLTFWYGFIILAGFGFYWIYQISEKHKYRFILKILLLIILFLLGYQTYLTSYKYIGDVKNPYSYSQPTKDIYKLTDKLNSIIKLVGTDEDLFINVIAEHHDYWPLPWYLRKSKFIGWNDSITTDIHKFHLIITQPKFEYSIIQDLYNNPLPGEKHLYIKLFEENIPIRPSNNFNVLIRNDIFEKYTSKLNNSLLIK